MPSKDKLPANVTFAGSPAQIREQARLFPLPRSPDGIAAEPTDTDRATDIRFRACHGLFTIGQMIQLESYRCENYRRGPRKIETGTLQLENFVNY